MTTTPGSPRRLSITWAASVSARQLDSRGSRALARRTATATARSAVVAAFTVNLSIGSRLQPSGTS